MYILLFLAITVIVYIRSFKENFNNELIDKVTPILMLVTGVILLLMLVSNILSLN